VTSISDFDNQRHNTDNWARVSYDKSRWIPMPGAWGGTPWADTAEWAFYQAEMAFLRGGRELNKKVVKKEVLPFSELLLYLYSTVVGKLAAQKYYLHCPNHTTSPVGAYIGLWKCMGTREEAFDYYGLWGTRTAAELQGPESEEFTAAHLGTGLRVRYSELLQGERMYSVNYVFRNEEYNTDVHVFMNARDEQRFLEALPETDAFVDQVQCTPRPSNNGRIIGPDGA
jgi:hypothetical protein